MNKADIKGKWALVTGASRGIGRQISLGLAEYGCNIILHSRELAGTEVLAAEVSAKGVEVHRVAAELSDANQVDAMVAELLATGPKVDILYNNAAIMTPYRTEWLVVPAQDFRDTFEVNVIALVRICYAFIPGMVERGWGRIINVSSGVKEQPNLVAYSISKGAIDKFVTDIAPTLKEKGVLVNLLDPGWLRTDLGGPNAPGSVESVVPGALVPALFADGTTGQLIRAQDYAGQEI